jgi:hypothetical protein
LLNGRSRGVARTQEEELWFGSISQREHFFVHRLLSGLSIDETFVICDISCDSQREVMSDEATNKISLDNCDDNIDNFLYNTMNFHIPKVQI